MACAVIFTAPFAMGPDQPVVSVAKNPPINSRLVVAIAKPPMVAANPPAMHFTENPSVLTPPVVAGPANPPSAATSPTVTAAQELPAVAVTAAPPIAFPAKNPSTVTVPSNAPIAAVTAPSTAAGKTGQSAVAKSTPVTMDAAQETGPTNPTVSAANPAVADAPSPAFDRRILAVHNRERQNLGLEPLSWNQALAQSARQWAEHLAATGRFEHAPENRSTPEGENLWAGTKGYYPPEAMVGAWIQEKKFFRPGPFPANSTTGRVEDIGHYTQVVWRATRQVGCAQAASANEDILVCRYGEAGNYRGEWPF